MDEQEDIIETGQELKKHHEQQVAELAEVTELLAAAKHCADSMKAELDPLREELKSAQETIADFDEKHASSIEDIERSSGLPVKVMIANRADILDAIKRYYK